MGVGEFLEEDFSYKKAQRHKKLCGLQETESPSRWSVTSKEWYQISGKGTKGPNHVGTSRRVQDLGFTLNSLDSH